LANSPSEPTGRTTCIFNGAATGGGQGDLEGDGKGFGRGWEGVWKE